MGDEYDRQRHSDRIVATLYRLDPDKLAAIRRAASGMTRCPECDALNPADQRKCFRCGAKLYYDLTEEEKPKDEKQCEDRREQEQKDQDSKPRDDSRAPPYY